MPPTEVPGLRVDKLRRIPLPSAVLPSGVSGIAASVANNPHLLHCGAGRFLKERSVRASGADLDRASIGGPD